MATEKRLIEVNSAWKKAQRIYSDPVLLHVIRNVLDETPTVDAVEVKHGRWILKETCGKNTEKFHCSVCDKIPKSLCVEDFCPNCGAKMDGDKHE
jgi:hypothetical protein